jgi:hypothetical protein
MGHAKRAARKEYQRQWRTRYLIAWISSAFMRTIWPTVACLIKLGPPQHAAALADLPVPSWALFKGQAVFTIACFDISEPSSSTTHNETAPAAGAELRQPMQLICRKLPSIAERLC